MKRKTFQYAIVRNGQTVLTFREEDGYTYMELVKMYPPSQGYQYLPFAGKA